MFRLWAANNFPKHRTIRDFRALHLKGLWELFVQVVKLARVLGLVKLGTVAIDGIKVNAIASRHKAMSYERMQQSEAELKLQIGPARYTRPDLATYGGSPLGAQDSSFDTKAMGGKQSCSVGDLLLGSRKVDGTRPFPAGG